jgi:hypothetical protein
VLAPRLRSVVYSENFKLRYDPNIWLSTYYVTVKAAGGSFDHMVAYFPLVMVTPRRYGSTTSRLAASIPWPTYPRPSPPTSR